MSLVNLNRVVRLWSATLDFIITRLLHNCLWSHDADFHFHFHFHFHLSFFLLIVQISTTGIQAQTRPSDLNTKFQVERIFAGDFEPSSMVFLGPDDILVLDRDEGKVFRVTHGIQSGPLIDVNVVTNEYRGLLGVEPLTKIILQMYFYILPSPRRRTVAIRFKTLLTHLEIGCIVMNLLITS